MPQAGTGPQLRPHSPPCPPAQLHRMAGGQPTEGCGLKRDCTAGRGVWRGTGQSTGGRQWATGRTEARLGRGGPSPWTCRAAKPKGPVPKGGWDAGQDWTPGNRVLGPGQAGATPRATASLGTGPTLSVPGSPRPSTEGLSDWPTAASDTIPRPGAWPRPGPAPTCRPAGGVKVAPSGLPVRASGGLTAFSRSGPSSAEGLACPGLGDARPVTRQAPRHPCWPPARLLYSDSS